LDLTELAHHCVRNLGESVCDTNVLATALSICFIHLSIRNAREGCQPGVEILRWLGGNWIPADARGISRPEQEISGEAAVPLDQRLFVASCAVSSEAHHENVSDAQIKTHL